jgi:hypothetical protein
MTRSRFERGVMQKVPRELIAAVAVLVLLVGALIGASHSFSHQSARLARIAKGDHYFKTARSANAEVARTYGAVTRHTKDHDSKRGNE